jgi:hypothetical protein
MLFRQLLSGAPFSDLLFPTVLMKSACTIQHHESAEDNENQPLVSGVISHIRNALPPKSLISRRSVFILVAESTEIADSVECRQSNRIDTLLEKEYNDQCILFLFWGNQVCSCFLGGHQAS